MKYIPIEKLSGGAPATFRESRAGSAGFNRSKAEDRVLKGIFRKDRAVYWCAAAAAATAGGSSLQSVANEANVLVAGLIFLIYTRRGFIWGSGDREFESCLRHHA
jgi:hypothetical protein